MKSKIILVFLLLVQGFILRAQNAVLTLDNTPLKKILEEISVFHHVTICNPENLIGLSISGKVRNDNSLDQLCKLLTSIESGVIFLRYQKGVIYVGKKRFPKNFSPDKSQWSCQ